MKNSIEAIWKEGFLNETSLVAPKINDLYNQKSKHLVDKMERMFRINLVVIIGTAIVFPLIYYVLDAVWEGAAGSLLLLLTAWYNKRQIDSIKSLDQGATSLEYLKSLDRWLRDVFLKSEKIARFSYPLYYLIAISTIWSAWNNQGLNLKIRHRFPDLLIIGDISLIALLFAGLTILLMFYFSAKIYRWEVRLMYGRVLDKLKETIAEMEKLKQGL
ncbi:hypothetical protein LZD49_20305 [Dyadobacter sp. CY261]|uniref:hypothetical protein n=1 Tax=Dyadobacter sp. CY261 TaxID=2907203 RepID=UPI001F20A420|nr:hypothetical protein [Dyadobacter sp. CY261]MCF0072834.1 hypothetical protein [Dyadobacter sp. CY261]